MGTVKTSVGIPRAIRAAKQPWSGWGVVVMWFDIVVLFALAVLAVFGFAAFIMTMFNGGVVSRFLFWHGFAIPAFWYVCYHTPQKLKEHSK